MKSDLLVAHTIHRFIAISECKELLFCQVTRELDRKSNPVIVIDCPSPSSHKVLEEEEITAVLQSLWRQTHLLVESARLLGLSDRVILKRRGHLFGSTSSLKNNQGDKAMRLQTLTNTCTYGELLLKVATAEYPTFISEVSKNWHWGQPQRIILTSADVTSFSGRKAPNWHGDDVTLLYEREVFQAMYEDLFREMETSPARAVLRDYVYRSYTVDTSREFLCRDKEHEYNSDIEIVYINDLDILVRICSCKERRPV